MAKGKDRDRDQERAPKETPAEKAAREQLEEEAQHMRHMAEEAGAAGGKASIFRRNIVAGVATGKDEFLESVPTRQIWDTVYEYLSERHGGGSYRICLKDEKGGFVPGASHLIYDIAGAPKRPTAETEEKRALDELHKRVEELSGQGKSADPVDMMRVLVDVTREQLRELRNPPAGAVHGNPMEMAANLVASVQAAQAPLLAALIERASSPAPDMIAQMRGMAEMMLTLRDLSGGDKPTGWGAISDRLADPLGKLIEQHVANQQTGAAPPSTMGGQPPMANPPAGAQPQQQQPPWLQMMGPYLPQLVRYAQLGRNPEVVADFVAEELPDRHLGMIYQTLSDPTFPDAFVRAVPDAREHLEWFTAFFSRVLEWVEPPDAPSSTSSAGENGAPAKPDVGNVADGEPGA